MMKLRYAIVGTGAMGGYYGGKLANAGYSVEFLLHSDYDFVKENGLRIDSILGDFHLKSVGAFRNPAEMTPADVIFVCLKTTQNYILKELLQPLLHEKSIIILLQNGLGVEEDVAKQFPNHTVTGGIAFICSQKIGPGHITHLDLGRIMIGAETQTRNTLDVLEQVCANFNDSGVEADLSFDLQLIRWRKLVWNIPFNGTTVIMNATTRDLIRNESTRPMIYALMEEVVAGANACGVSLSLEYARKMIDMTETMTPYEPSMKIDFDNRRPLEIEYIYSRPIEKAAEAGYEMKLVKMLEQQLHFVSRRY